ncbi:MAG TPA: hypothetical protein VFW71_10435 [Actinomycetota bacterium]|nr:hypothetical protein [Actinomycetota bacterium]
MRAGELAPPPPVGTPSGWVLRIGQRAIPVVGPSWRDPRLHVAAVIVSLQVLGQAVLGFQLSIAQILVTILTCAALEVGITLVRRQVLLWPASALLTGNGVALLLRATGTGHGQWWSLQGAGYFALAGTLSLGSKYVLRGRGGHIFNPSNFGLVCVFLLFGTRVVNPQDLWWGPMSPGLALTMVVIVAGGLTLVARVRMVGTAVAFWVVFAVLTGVTAATGHCMTARWHLGPVCGGSYWWSLALSPEILVFLFFMITDPKTAPEGRASRVAFGALVGLLAALAVAPAGTEFWTKLGVLGALAVACAGRPFIDAAVSRFGRAWGRRLAPLATGGVVLAVAGLVVAGLPARPTAAAVPAQAMAPRHITVSPPALPPSVGIDPSVGKVVGGVPPALAQQLASALAGDLALEAQALQNRDRAVAAEAGTGDWLAALDRTIAQGGLIEVPTYHLTKLTVVAVPNPLRPQDPPRLGVVVTGSVQWTAEGTAIVGQVVRAPSPGLHETFVMAPSPGAPALISAVIG